MATRKKCVKCNFVVPLNSLNIECPKKRFTFLKVALNHFRLIFNQIIKDEKNNCLKSSYFQTSV